MYFSIPLEALPFLPLGYYVRQTANKRGTGNENKREKSLGENWILKALGKSSSSCSYLHLKNVLLGVPAGFGSKNPFWITIPDVPTIFRQEFSIKISKFIKSCLQSSKHTILKVKFLSKNSILTKPQHFHKFFTQNFFDNFSREIKVVNS